MLNGHKKHTTILAMLVGLLPVIIGVALLGILKAQNGSTVVNYLTLQLDSARTGWNSQETQLTPANIRMGGMRELWRNTNLNGQVYAAPLYYNNNDMEMLIVVTQTNKLYVLNARTGAILHDRYIGELEGRQERALMQFEFDLKSRGTCFDINDRHGITSTPVIDPDTNILYLVNLTMENNEQVYKLHAIDLSPARFGREVIDPPGFPVKIAGRYAGQAFQAFMQTQRGALTLHDGILYIPFSSRCDAYSWHGWVFGYDVSAPREPVQVFCTSPDGDGAGMWGQGGVSIALEPDGAFGYVVTGNANTDTFTPEPGKGMSLAQSVLRLNLKDPLNLFSYGDPRNYFTLPDYIWTSIVDTDLGGSSALVIPEQSGTNTPRLLLTAGKDGRVYLLNRDNLGGQGGELQHLNVGRGIRVAPSYFEDAATGKHLTYVTLTGTDGPGNNYIDWQNDPISVAAESEGDLSVALSSGPAMAEFGNRLFVAWVNYDPSDPSDRSVMIKSSPDAKDWSGEAISVGGQALVRTSPSLAVFNNKLYLCWIDNDTRRITVKSSADGVDWSDDGQLLNPVATSDVFNTWATMAVFNNTLYLAYLSSASPYNIMLTSTMNGTDWSATDTPIHTFSSARLGQGAPYLIAFNGKLYAFWVRSTGNPPDEDRSIDYKASTDGSTWPATPSPFNESVYRNSGLGGLFLNTAVTGPTPGPPRLHVFFVSNSLARTALVRSLGTGTATNPDATGNQDALAVVDWPGPRRGVDGGQIGAAVFRGKAYYAFGTRLPNRELRLKSGTAVNRESKGLTALQLTVDPATRESRFYPAWTSPLNTYNNYLPGSPFVTSNGGSSGVVWVAEGWSNEGSPGVLHAHNAVTGEELFPVTSPLPVGGRKFQSVVVVNGRVYLASNGVVAYGLR